MGPSTHYLIKMAGPTIRWTNGDNEVVKYFNAEAFIFRDWTILVLRQAVEAMAAGLPVCSPIKLARWESCGDSIKPGQFCQAKCKLLAVVLKKFDPKRL